MYFALATTELISPIQQRVLGHFTDVNERFLHEFKVNIHFPVLFIERWGYKTLLSRLT